MSHDLSARELCERALRKIGAFPVYDTAADPEELDEALYWLDIRMALLAGKTTIFWLIPSTLSFAIAAGTQSYNLKTILAGDFPTDGIQFPKTVHLEDSGGNREPLKMISRREFERFEDPDRTGTPEFVHIDRLGIPTLKVWPTLGTGATGFTIKLVVQTYAKDFVGDDAKGDKASGLRAAWGNWAIFDLSYVLGDGPVRRLPVSELTGFREEAERNEAMLLGFENREHTDYQPIVYRDF